MAEPTPGGPRHCGARVRRCRQCDRTAPPWAEECSVCGSNDFDPDSTCRKAAVRGTTVCASHGGRAPQVKARAARRLAAETASGRSLAEAKAEVRRLGGQLPSESVMPVRSLPPRLTTLYRAYDAAGRLLYVGIAWDVFDRMARHRRFAAWYADMASLTTEHFGTRAEAMEAEARAIRDEHPLHNLAGVTAVDG